MFPVSSMFDVFFRDLRTGSPFTKMDASPSADVYRRDGAIIVLVDLPGVVSSDVKVDVENGWLLIVAERTYSPEPGDTVYLSERPFGRFERRFKIGAGVSPEHVSAKFANGVLELKITTPEEPKRSSIAIETSPES